MSIFEELSGKALTDEYFKALLIKSEICAASNFFHVRKKELDEKEFHDLLRFSDILSRSKDAEAQNKAYKIISLLVDDYKDNASFRTFASSVPAFFKRVVA